jgi:hypothetical protein
MAYAEPLTPQEMVGIALILLGIGPITARECGADGMRKP